MLALVCLRTNFSSAKGSGLEYDRFRIFWRDRHRLKAWKKAGLATGIPPPRQVSIGKAWEIKRMRGSP